MTTSTKTIDSNLVQTDQNQQNKMETYYSFQSKIYDLTRWSFLFGRANLVYEIPAIDPKSIIVEVGCGTGYNLQKITKQFPRNPIIGIDISSSMLRKAQKKVKNPRLRFINAAYNAQILPKDREVDVIVFSYALSMINPDWSTLIDQAKRDLSPGGFIAVVDFEYSRFSWFSKHMSNHHVNMEKHLRPYLESQFHPVINESKPAYGGVWNYFTFIGQKTEE